MSNDSTTAEKAQPIEFHATVTGVSRSSTPFTDGKTYGDGTVIYDVALDAGHGLECRFKTDTPPTINAAYDVIIRPAAENIRIEGCMVQYFNGAEAAPESAE